LLETVPQSSDADGNFQPLKTPLLKLAQRQIRLRLNPTAQGSVMLFKAGASVTADLLGAAHAGETVLLPKPLHTFTADTKTPTYFAGALTAFSRSDNSLSQILTQRPHKSLFIEKE
jgi:hypothetical protein